jgi:hypothetical protein
LISFPKLFADNDHVETLVRVAGVDLDIRTWTTGPIGTQIQTPLTFDRERSLYQFQPRCSMQATKRENEDGLLAA